MTKEHKLGLVLVTVVATAGLAYCAYTHKEEIYNKIEDLKNEIAKKKSELGDKGRDKLNGIIQKVIHLLENQTGTSSEMDLRKKDIEIEMLKKELEALKA